MKETRLQKALVLARSGKVKAGSCAGHYVVVGSRPYHVDLITGNCTCDDYQMRGRIEDQPCKHILAAGLVDAAANVVAAKSVEPVRSSRDYLDDIERRGQEIRAAQRRANAAYRAQLPARLR